VRFGIIASALLGGFLNPTSSTMQKAKTPKTDLHASIIFLGTDYFGSTVSREDSMRLIDHYLEPGGNVLDTAES
jgi:aryl-alcohol dehydrogenase-like predicted oxidoreductase